MMKVIGEMRSAHARGDKRELARLVLEARGDERFEVVLRYARGLDADVLSPDRLVQWSVVTDSQGRTDRYEGSLDVCGVAVDVPDMEEVTRRWSTRPGWYVLDVWESNAWVRSAEGAHHRGAPRRYLETVDAYLRGEAPVEAARRAQAAASDAAYAAACVGFTYASADANAAYSAAYAAYAAYATTRNVAASADAAAFAAANALRYVVDTYANDIAAKEREMWHEDWRWHLLWHALKFDE